MTFKTISIAALGICLLQSCGGSSTTHQNSALPAAPLQEAPPVADIAYTVAQGYFVKNTVPQGALPHPRIDTQQDFDQVFGPGATMGKDGRPTAIDFARQYVIAVVAGETDIATELKPVSLHKEAGNIVFTYEVVQGDKQSYTIRPALLIVVDKTNEGAVIIKKQ